jgi:hypothetical protein
MRIKIKSHGRKREHITVIDENTGEMLEGIQSIDFHADVEDHCYAILKVLIPEVDLIVDDVKVEKI